MPDVLPGLESAFFKSIPDTQRDQVKTRLALEAINSEIEAHQSRDKSRSYLGHAFNYLWWQDGNRLHDLQILSDQTQSKVQGSDFSSADALYAKAQKEIDSDQKAVKLKDEITYYGSTLAKMVPFFMSGTGSWYATAAMFAADDARPGDPYGKQVLDGTLGAVKGVGLKAIFSEITQTHLNPGAKGAFLGITGRVVDEGLTAETYAGAAGKFDFMAGVSKTTRDALNPRAIGMDAIVFGTAYGASSLLTSYVPGFDTHPFAQTVTTAGLFGVTSGSLNEAQRERDRGQSIDWTQVALRGGLEGMVYAIAASPAGYQAETQYQKMQKQLEDDARAAADRAAQEARAKAQEQAAAKSPQDLALENSPVKTVVQEYLKQGTVQAEQLTERLQWQTSKGETMTGEAGDWKITQPNGSTSTIKDDIFQKTYSSVEGKPGEFAKTAITKAQVIDKPVVIKSLEGSSQGNIGDYLVTGPNGEQYVVTKANFEKLYKFASGEPIGLDAAKLPMLSQDDAGNLYNQLKDNGEYTFEKPKYTVDVRPAVDGEEIVTIKGDKLNAKAGQYIISRTMDSGAVDTYAIDAETLAKRWEPAGGQASGEAGTYATKAVPTKMVQLDGPTKIALSWDPKGVSGDAGDFLAMYRPGDYNIVHIPALIETYVGSDLASQAKVDSVKPQK